MRIKLKEKRRNGIFDGDDEVIGIIDVDGKLPNLALMKISAYFKKAGERVEFIRAGREYEKIYAAALFTRSKESCGRLVEMYGDKKNVWRTMDERADGVSAAALWRKKPDTDSGSYREKRGSSANEAKIHAYAGIS